MDFFDHVDPTAGRRASGKAIRYALRALGVRDAWNDAVAKATPETRDWWDWTDPVAEAAPKLVRLCGKVGITPAALLDAALAD